MVYRYSIETISKSNIKYVSSGLALEVLVNLFLTLPG